MSDDEIINAIDAELTSRFDQEASNYNVSRSDVFFNELEGRVVEDWALGGRWVSALLRPCPHFRQERD